MPAFTKVPPIGPLTGHARVSTRIHSHSSIDQVLVEDVGQIRQLLCENEGVYRDEDRGFQTE
jgi:hypothetical protein